MTCNEETFDKFCFALKEQSLRNNSGTFYKMYKSADDDQSYLYDDEYFDDRHSEALEDNEERIYVCDYEKIYICLYEELEEYRTSKQAKKKNAKSTWNNLLVIMPSGETTSMKNAPSNIPKNAQILRANKKLKRLRREITQARDTKENTKIKSKSKINTDFNSYAPGVDSLKTAEHTELIEEKMLKKKLKKQRQKEKKILNKKVFEEKEKFVTGDESKNEVTIKVLESVVIQKDFNDKGLTNSEDDDDSVPSFASSVYQNFGKEYLIRKEEEEAVKASNSSEKTRKSVATEKEAIMKNKEELIKSDQNYHQEQSTEKSLVLPDIGEINSDSDSQFEVYRKVKRNRASVVDHQKSISLGIKALRKIELGYYSQSIKILTSAINNNEKDFRHFLNRCLCYLRSGQFNLALRDALTVIRNSNDPRELIKAKLFSGQAYCALGNFWESEKCLIKASNYNKDDMHIRFELLHVKIMKLLEMGFERKDILKAFKTFGVSETDIDSIISFEKEEDEKHDDCEYRSDDDVYISDDEKDPCLTRIFTNLISRNSQLNSSDQKKNISQAPITLGREANGIKVITAAPPEISLVNKTMVNDKAVWVGGVIPEITEKMLKKRFSKCGKILSVFKKPNENYAFVNFENAKTVSDLLTSSVSIECEGHKLIIKSANKTKLS